MSPGVYDLRAAVPHKLRCLIEGSSPTDAVKTPVQGNVIRSRKVSTAESYDTITLLALGIPASLAVTAICISSKGFPRGILVRTHHPPCQAHILQPITSKEGPCNQQLRSQPEPSSSVGQVDATAEACQCCFSSHCHASPAANAQGNGRQLAKRAHTCSSKAASGQTTLKAHLATAYSPM